MTPPDMVQRSIAGDAARARGLPGYLDAVLQLKRAAQECWPNAPQLWGVDIDDAQCRLDGPDFSRDDVGSRGFALMEVIVAFAVLAMMIAAVANLTNTTRRGVVHVEHNFAEVEIAGGLVATPPTRDDIAALSSKGQLDGYVWGLAAAPFRAPFSLIGQTPRWIPAKIELSVRSRSGAPFRLEMVRLIRPRPP